LIPIPHKMAAENTPLTTADAVELDITTAEVNKARAAHNSGDVEASKAAHQAKTGHLGSPEKHGGTASEYLKSIVFGGLDGIITTFAIVAASAGGEFPTEVVLMMGFANLIADGISMGFGDFLSSKAELDFAKLEYAREKWEVENNPQGEIDEMVEIFEKKGMATEDAKTVMNIFAKHEEMWLDLMMVEELGILTPDPDDSPAKAGCVTMLSFFVFGSIPLWFYVGFHAGGYTDKNVMFAVACASTGLAIFSLGFFKAFFTHQNKILSGLGMFMNGAFAAAAAYFIGYAFEAGLEIDLAGCGGNK